ncbi:MAG TPA: hypothetical protein VGK17_19500 [Propionicimonas sp.]
MTTGSPRLVLIAGPSGSGKSRLAHVTGCPALRLDDFYFDADHPDMPRSPIGIIDWDDPRSWNAEAAVAALAELVANGQVEVPAYSISESRRVGSHLLSLDGASCLTAEGIFAIDFLAVCRTAGLATEAIYIDRPGVVVFWLRLRRDLKEEAQAADDPAAPRPGPVARPAGPAPQGHGRRLHPDEHAPGGRPPSALGNHPDPRLTSPA